MRCIFYVALALCAMVLTACKTNEKNMNDAYVKAMAGREAQADEFDDIIYNSIRKEMKHGTMVVAGDTVGVSTQYVNVTDGGGGIRENLKRYCVVVGQFKQIFNAKSMRTRLVDEGYPGAFVVNTREPYYFVVAASFDDAHDAVIFLEKTAADPHLSMKAPLPFILEPAQLRR